MSGPLYTVATEISNTLCQMIWSFRNAWKSIICHFIAYSMEIVDTDISMHIEGACSDRVIHNSI